MDLPLTIDQVVEHRFAYTPETRQATVVHVENGVATIEARRADGSLLQAHLWADTGQTFFTGGRIPYTTDDAEISGRHVFPGRRLKFPDADTVAAFIPDRSPARPDLTLRELQTSLPWSIRYSEDFRRNPQSHKDFAHGLTHVFKAAGKLAALVDDMDHRKETADSPAIRENVPYLADLVVCALRMANTWPGGVVDLQRAVEDRLESKNDVKLPRPAYTVPAWPSPPKTLADHGEPLFGPALTVTMSGPQACGKTRLTAILRERYPEITVIDPSADAAWTGVEMSGDQRPAVAAFAGYGDPNVYGYDVSPFLDVSYTQAHGYIQTVDGESGPATYSWSEGNYTFSASQVEGPFVAEPDEVHVSGPRAEVFDLFNPTPKAG